MARAILRSRATGERMASVKAYGGPKSYSEILDLIRGWSGPAVGPLLPGEDGLLARGLAWALRDDPAEVVLIDALPAEPRPEVWIGAVVGEQLRVVRVRGPYDSMPHDHERAAVEVLIESYPVPVGGSLTESLRWTGDRWELAVRYEHDRLPAALEVQAITDREIEAPAFVGVVDLLRAWATRRPT